MTFNVHPGPGTCTEQEHKYTYVTPVLQCQDIRERVLLAVNSFLSPSCDPLVIRPLNTQRPTVVPLPPSYPQHLSPDESVRYSRASWQIWRRSEWTSETPESFATVYFLILPAAKKAKARSQRARLEKSHPQVPKRTKEGVFHHSVIIHLR